MGHGLCAARVWPCRYPWPMSATPRSLTGLLPFLKPYRWPLVLAGVFLLLAAGATLAFPWTLKQLIDQGLSQTASAQDLALHFAELFGVAAALAVFASTRAPCNQRPEGPAPRGGPARPCPSPRRHTRLGQARVAASTGLGAVAGPSDQNGGSGA